MNSVSVVIPVRNDRDLLDRCLTALANQTVAAHEIIIVDNASTDDSAAVAKSHGARVIEEHRVGIPCAAAAGYDSARGAIIARCDADTIVGPDWIQTITAALAEKPQVSAVTGWGVFYDLPPVLRHVSAALYLGSYYALGGLAAGHHVLWGSSMAIRKSAWNRVSSLVHRDDPELHDDMDLALVLGPNAKISLVPALRVGVSGRSIHLSRQWRPRMSRAFRTLNVNWRVMPPWDRWYHRLTSSKKLPGKEMGEQ